MSTVDNVADTEENVELPDDFFDEFEDSKFLDEIVEIVVPEQTRLVRPDEVNDNSTETSKSSKSSNDQPNEEGPLLKRCLNEINNLTKSIKRRKQRLRGETTTTDNGKRKNRRSHSPPSSRLDRNVRSRDHRLSPARRSPSGSRSRRVRSRSRERNRSRDRRLSRSRRDRSRSDSPANKSRGMSFLEELERKFAENGQDFPEKDLLIQMRAKQNGTTGMHPYPATVGYQQVPYIQLPNMHIPMPMYNRPYQPQWNGNYMMDPMASMQHPMQPIPLPSPCVNGMTPNVIQNATTASK